MSAPAKSAKSQYSETEAAAQLGVSLEQLRSLIRDRILPDDDHAKPMGSLKFQPADLLLLKLLVSWKAGPPPTGSLRGG